MSEPVYTSEDFNLLNKKLPWPINKQSWSDIIWGIPHDQLPLHINTPDTYSNIKKIIIKWRLEIGK